MHTIGHRGSIYNVPTCVEIIISQGTLCLTNHEDAVLDIDTIQEEILRALERGFTKVHFACRLQGHTFLTSVSIKDGLATLTIFDALPEYHNRYDKDVISSIKMLLPDSIALSDSEPTFRHILVNSKPHLNGYYTLYTALLLTQNEDSGLLDGHMHNTVFYGESDGVAICADWVVRTLLHFHVAECEESWSITKKYLNRDKLREQSHWMTEGIFIKVPNQLPKIMNQLEKRVWK